MTNRLMTIDEMAKDIVEAMSDHNIPPREFALALAYNAACAYDEDEERQVRTILGLESTQLVCISCGSATQPCCGQ